MSKNNNVSSGEIQSIFFNKKGFLNLKPDLFVNTFLGLFLALIFNDFKNDIFDGLFLKAIENKIAKKKIKLLGIEYDTFKLIRTGFHILLLIIFFLAIYLM